METTAYAVVSDEELNSLSTAHCSEVGSSSDETLRIE
jgi:hypothetical protein